MYVAARHTGSAGTTAEYRVRLKPDAQAKYDVVDKVMATAQQVGVTKMGFVGNEDYADF